MEQDRRQDSAVCVVDDPGVDNGLKTGAKN
jgi:hypothetical protein